MRAICNQDYAKCLVHTNVRLKGAVSSPRAKEIHEAVQKIFSGPIPRPQILSESSSFDETAYEELQEWHSLHAITPLIREDSGNDEFFIFGHLFMQQ